MSLIRPELAEALRPWREAAIWGAVTLAGLLLFLRGAVAGGPLLVVLGLLMIGGGAALLVGALRRRRLEGREPDEGIVQIREARIGYFGPRGGGFVDLDGIERVDIATDGARASWWITGAEGGMLRIPLGARGAEGIYDALSAAVPLDEEALKAALATRQPARFPLWVRTGAEAASMRRLR